MSVNLHDVVVVVLDGDGSSLAVHDAALMLVVNVDVLEVVDVLPIFDVVVVVVVVVVVSSCHLMMFMI